MSSRVKKPAAPGAHVKYSPGITPAPSALIQRKCACGHSAGVAGKCEECSNQRLTAQRRAAGQAESHAAPPIVKEALRSPGQPLDTGTRSFMESRFGHDFSRVRVHSDGHAAESARAAKALAYTAGQDIVFGQGLYQPKTDEGRHLLAHELTHVVQQRETRARDSRGEALGATVLRSESLEREADAWGDAITRGHHATGAGRAGPLHYAPTITAAPAVQLQDDPNAAKTDAEAQAPAPQTPLEQAEALVKESPATVKDRATWILKAAEQGFVTFNTTKARENVENVRDEKKVENLDPKAAGYDVPILEVEVGLAKKVAQRWIDAKGVGAKQSIQFGSMIRSGNDPHGKAKAIDINALSMTTSVDATIVVLNDLDKDIHSSYGLGLPFQGDFFDPADNLDTKKQAAQSSAAPPAEEKKTETGGTPAPATPAPTTGAGATPEAKTESQPVTATVTNAVQKFTSHIYQSTGTRGADNKWVWQDSIQTAGAAYTRLKSQTLKDTLASRRKDGFSFTIFPDNDNHLHLDVR